MIIFVVTCPSMLIFIQLCKTGAYALDFIIKDKFKDSPDY